jgi:hypothetical protein
MYIIHIIMIENYMIFSAPDCVNRQAPRRVYVQFLGGLVYCYTDVTAVHAVHVPLGKGTLVIQYMLTVCALDMLAMGV